MIRYVLEFRTKAGQGEAAVKLLQEMKAYFQASHQSTLDVFYQAIGTPGTFQGVMDFGALADFEKVSHAMRTDSTYRALAARARDIFFEESMHTSLYYKI